MYESRGIAASDALAMAQSIMSDPELALEVHAREELGIDPNKLGNPIEAAASSFVAFSVGAVLPLLPWFFAGGTAAVVASIILGLLGTIAVGVALAQATGRPALRTAGRQVLIATFAAGVTFLIGSLVGTEVS